MAVFGGIAYGRWRTAVAAPLLALVLSDLAREYLDRLGLTTHWGRYRGMGMVYGTTALIALLSRLARGTRRVGVIAAATLLGSVVFFLVTNLAVWAGGRRYPHPPDGMLDCYVAALPFFRNALAGEAAYAALMFAAWALAERRVPGLRPDPVPAR